MNAQPISGLKLKKKKKTIRIKQYVDDSVIFIENLADISLAYEAVKKFCYASRMKVNWDKTDGIWFGEWSNNPPFTQAPNTPIK